MRNLKITTVLLFSAIASAMCEPAWSAETPPQFVRSWGREGSSPGWFYGPTAIAGDAAGSIYVSDGLNDRIEKFDANGNFLYDWGFSGSGPGQFYFPWGIDCDAAGNVYVSDLDNNRIQKFTKFGGFLTQWGSYGTEPGQWINAPFFAIDESDQIYLGDGVNNRIQKFDSNGTLLAVWETPGFAARGMAAGGGRVYAVDHHTSQIRVFDTQGNPQATFGSAGYGYGELFWPWDLELDDAGNLYVTSVDDSRITKFSPSHEVLSQWGTSGAGPGQFGNEQAVYVHPNRLIYIVDRQHARVEVFEAGAVPATPVSWGAIKAS